MNHMSGFMFDDPARDVYVYDISGRCSRLLRCLLYVNVLCVMEGGGGLFKLD